MRYVFPISAFLLAGVLAIYGLLPGPSTSRAAFHGANCKIAFTTSRDGASQIYAMAANGSNRTNISNDPVNKPDECPDIGLAVTLV